MGLLFHIFIFVLNFSLMAHRYHKNTKKESVFFFLLCSSVEMLSKTA